MSKYVKAELFIKCMSCGKLIHSSNDSEEFHFCPFCGKQLITEKSIVVKYMGTKEASEKWYIPQGVISQWCKKGLIEGAEQDAPKSPWRIPVNAEHPDYNPRFTDPFTKIFCG